MSLLSVYSVYSVVDPPWFHLHRPWCPSPVDTTAGNVYGSHPWRGLAGRAMGEGAPGMATSDIVIRGAREHNLRDVSLTLPRGRLICLTGVSGSGKSSLAFDTLYAEGQRR